MCICWLIIMRTRRRLLECNFSISATKGSGYVRMWCDWVYRRILTFVSEAKGSRSWLDHCVVSTSALLTVPNIQVVDGVYWSDHYPLQLTCNLHIIRTKLIVQNESNNMIVWGLRSEEEVERYLYM